MGMEYKKNIKQFQRMEKLIKPTFNGLTVKAAAETHKNKKGCKPAKFPQMRSRFKSVNTSANSTLTCYSWFLISNL